MKKGQVIGLVVTALAVVGGVAVYNWVRKPKQNADGFFNASGKSGKVSANCGRRNTDGSYSYYANIYGGDCKSGYKAVAYFGDRGGL